MRWTPIALLLALGGCSFIDDFDFEIADGSVAADDGGTPDDGGERDGSMADGGGDVDGGTPPGCTDPCLSDAVEDFGSAQGSGPLQWRYLNDRRQETGLQYGELALSTYLEAPAWTDATPPPAIVDCQESTAEGCADGRLLFAADQPGSGSDPVLSFTAPDDGTYVVVVDVLSVDGGPATVTVSRTSRLDTVAVGELSGPGSVTGVVDLLEGDRALVTVAPAADPGDAIAVGANVRVSRVIGAEPLEDCELVARFDTDAPFALGCTDGELSQGPGFTDSTEASGPSTAHGAGRAWVRNARALNAQGQSLDYSGDFTLQLWMLIDDLNVTQPAVYLDATAATAETAGGMLLSLDRESADGLRSNIATAVYYFGGDAMPPTDPSVTCDSGAVCRGAIEGSIPAFDEWHFYRIVRRADLDEVRFCIDGELVGTGFLDGDIDISPRAAPRLGGDGDGTGNALVGALDDVRIFSKALPCGD